MSDLGEPILEEQEEEELADVDDVDEENPDVEEKTILDIGDDANDEDDENDENITSGEDDVAPTFDVINTSQHKPTVLQERVTVPMLSRYERARIMGMRCKQLSEGELPLLALHDMPAGLQATRDGAIANPYPVAMLEIKRRVLPVIVRRHLTDGSFEDWSLHELQVE